MTMILTLVLTVSFLLAVLVIDYKHHLIPNKLTMPVLVLGLVLAFFNGVFLDNLIAALIGFALLLIPFILGWVGGGDVKFLAALGAVAGWKVLVHAALLGLVLAGLVSVYRLFRRGGIKGVVTGLMFVWLNKSAASGGSQDFIPLGTFMSVAGLLYLLAKALGW